MTKNCYKNMGWLRITMILCMFGFLKEFRPSEPFVTDYLTSGKNFTVQQVMQDIYPVGTYSYLATLVLVFLLTDFLRYKPVIILCGLSGVATYVAIILGDTIPWMQFLQFTYGLFMSTEIAYYTYIYAKVGKEQYQAVSSYTRSAFLCGRFLSGVVAQLTTSFRILNYHQLNYLTLAGSSLATCWALFLPPVQKSLYFHRPDETRVLSHESGSEVRRSREIFTSDVTNNRSNLRQKIERAFVYLWSDFLRAYTNYRVLKWSLWWAFATCGYLQVLNYVQPLWQTAVEKNAVIYNGAVEAAYTIIGALAVFAIGKLRLNWAILGEGVLSIFSFLEALLLFLSSINFNIWLLYAFYIIFGVVYHTMITVASFEVAKNLSDDSYALIFGINTLLALALQSLLTFVVVSGNVFRLQVRTQFQIYAGYFVVLGTVFFVMAAYTIITFLQSRQKFSPWLRKNSSKAATNNIETYENTSRGF